jgi:hypothetical protein
MPKPISEDGEETAEEDVQLEADDRVRDRRERLAADHERPVIRDPDLQK